MRHKVVAGGAGAGILAAVMAVAVAGIKPDEGLSLKSYQDIVGVWTACYGRTAGVGPNQTYTLSQCEEFLENEVYLYATEVDRLVTVPMTVNQHAAFTRFSYNVGLGAFSKSTLLKKMNALDVIGACDEMRRWNKVTIMGKLVASKGLTARRERERALCLQ